MAAARTVFDILRSEQDPAADAALLAALEQADAPTAQAIIETLLTRNTKAGLLGLVQSFHLIDESLRQVVLVEWERLFGVLREASLARVQQTRLNVLEIVKRACIYRASYLVDSAIRCNLPAVRQAAAETLCCLANELLRSGPVPLCDSDLAAMTPEDMSERMRELEEHAEDRRQVVSAIEAALNTLDLHHQTSVVEVAMWFVDDATPAFWSVMTVPNSKAGKAAIRLLSTARGPQLVPFAMAALNFAEFRPYVVKVLTDGPDPLFMEEWLRQSWRLVQPRVSRAMTSLKAINWASHADQDLLALAPASHRHLARWIVSTGLDSREKLDLLRLELAQGDPRGRRSALWALTETLEMQANEVLRGVDDPEDGEMQSIARRALARRCPLEMPVSRLLSLEAWTRESLSRELPKDMTFEQYWRAFDCMNDVQRRDIGGRMVQATPMLDSLLSRRLTGSEMLESIRAIRMISVLDLAERFEEKLYTLCHDARPEVRSAAVAVIAPLKNAVSRRLVRTALNDADLRVQANAVEAVAAAGHENVVDDLMEKLSSPDNRVQANAVKALLRLGVREAAETLLRMLQDEHRTHRISALWLIERMGLFTLANRVAGMSDADPDPTVRKRATQLSSQLIVPVSFDAPVVAKARAPASSQDAAAAVSMSQPAAAGQKVGA
jgi:hypothetical protein